MYGYGGECRYGSVISITHVASLVNNGSVTACSLLRWWTVGVLHCTCCSFQATLDEACTTAVQGVTQVGPRFVLFL